MISFNGLAFPMVDGQWWLRKQRPTQFSSNKNRPKDRKPRTKEPAVGAHNIAIEKLEELVKPKNDSTVKP